jgi:hypothetical protein
MASSRRWFVVLVATALGSVQTPDATISGVVIDYAARPVRNATVLFKPLDGGIERSASTDGSGEYRADHLTPGEYQVVSLHGGEHAFERVRVQGSLTLPLIVFSPDVVCECSLVGLSETNGAIQLSHHDASGNRLLRSWVMVEPGTGPSALGPRTLCLCGDSPSLLGHRDLLRDGFNPGRYVVRGAAAGYASWTLPDVVVTANHVTEIEVTWKLADTRAAETSARADLRGGETLVRIETFAGTEFIAVADTLDGQALLTAIDAHRFDNRALERPNAGVDQWRIQPRNDLVPLGSPSRAPEEDLLDRVLARRASFVRVVSGDAVPSTWLKRTVPMMAVSRVW